MNFPSFFFFPLSILIQLLSTQTRSDKTTPSSTVPSAPTTRLISEAALLNTAGKKNLPVQRQLLKLNTLLAVTLMCSTGHTTAPRCSARHTRVQNDPHPMQGMAGPQFNCHFRQLLLADTDTGHYHPHDIPMAAASPNHGNRSETWNTTSFPLPRSQHFWWTLFSCKLLSMWQMSTFLVSSGLREEPASSNFAAWILLTVVSY